MRASDLLQEMVLKPFAFVENHSGREAVAIDLEAWRVFQNVFPEIVTVVEAAEEHEARKLLPSNETLWALEAALASLTGKLSATKEQRSTFASTLLSNMGVVS